MRFPLSKNKKPKGKRSCLRSETGTTNTKNDKRKKKNHSERRQDIFLKLKELNVTVGDHMYLDLYQKKVKRRNRKRNLEDRTSTLPVTSTPKVPKFYQLQVSPEAASSFISHSKSKGKAFISRRL